MKIFATSDIHGQVPEIPEGADLFLVAGDLSMGFDRKSLQEKFWFDTLPGWASAHPSTRIVATGGNHDFILEEILLGHLPMPVYSDNLEIVVGTESKLAAELGLRVYCTPYNDTIGWAFALEPVELASQFGQIPRGLDILLTHMPPAGCGAGRIRMRSDGTWQDHDLGNRALADQIRDVRPGLVICGHVHERYGSYDLDGIPVLNVAYVDKNYEAKHAPRLIPVPQLEENQSNA